MHHSDIGRLSPLLACWQEYYVLNAESKGSMQTALAPESQLNPVCLLESEVVSVGIYQCLGYCAHALSTKPMQLLPSTSTTSSCKSIECACGAYACLIQNGHCTAEAQR